MLYQISRKDHHDPKKDVQSHEEVKIREDNILDKRAKHSARELDSYDCYQDSQEYRGYACDERKKESIRALCHA